MSGEPEELKLGNLLNYFGLITDQDVTKGLALSQQTGLPLGKCLSMLDLLNPATIRAAIEAQSMIKDGLLELYDAREAMGMVYRKKWMLSDALIGLGVEAYASKGTRLGELLSAARCINVEQLDMSLRVSDTSGLPLGRVLLLLNRISSPSLELALSLQKEVRLGQLNLEQAQSRLEKELIPPVHGNDSNSGPGSASGLSSGSSGQKIKLGEMLVLARLLTPTEVMSAVDMAQANDKMIGEVLIEMGWLSEDLLTATLKLQEMIWKSQLSAAKAADLLSVIHKTNVSLEQAVKDTNSLPNEVQRNLQFLDFLRLSGYLSRESTKNVIGEIMANPDLISMIMKNAQRTEELSSGYLKEAIKQSFRDASMLANILRHLKPKEEQVIESGLAIHELLQRGKLTLEQALINFAMRKNQIENESD